MDNDSDGNFNPPFPGPLPSSGTDALLFDGGGTDLSTNNAADFIVTPGSAVFINNATVPGMFTVVECTANPDCEDSDPCTTDACVANVCENTPIPCDDGVFCNGLETCVAGSCVNGTAPCTGTCNENTDACAPALSWLGMGVMSAAVAGVGAILAKRRKERESTN